MVYSVIECYLISNSGNGRKSLAFSLTRFISFCTLGKHHIWFITSSISNPLAAFRQNQIYRLEAYSSLNSIFNLWTCNKKWYKKGSILYLLNYHNLSQRLIHTNLPKRYFNKNIVLAKFCSSFKNNL